MSGFLIGLTGGLASGKSTVARMFGELGCTVLDADRVVADLYRPGGEGTAAVRSLFGDGVLDATGAVNRPKLAERVFGDPQARKQLEAAIHPLVQQHSTRRMAEAVAAGKIVVYEATLLVEAGRADDFDLVVTVEAPEEVRLARAMVRGMDEASARARLHAQGDGATRRARADRTIDSSGSLDEVRRQVEALLAEIRSPGVTLVTGNRNKVLEAERILGRPLRSKKIDLPEIQALDVRQVLRAKAEEAWQRLRRPLIVEDVALELDALGGFPGPLVKWMLEAVGPEGIARTALALGDPGVAARCVLLYKDADREILAEGLTRGHLVLPPRGDGGFGWDPVVEALGLGKTFAEMSGEEKDLHGHRGRAWRALLEQLEQP